MDIRRIVILGGGATGWMVAASLSRALEKTAIFITLVELESEQKSPSCWQDRFGVESLGPTAQIFHEAMEWDEAGLLAETDGVFSLGSIFEDWQGEGQYFIQSFGDSGARFYGRDFQHYYTKFKQQLQLPEYHQFSLSAMAAARGRFCHPVNDQRSVLSTLSYGLNVDSQQYAQQLRRYAQAKGVAVKRGVFVRADLAEDGSVTQVLLDSESVSGDFFLDCSGPQSLLLGKTLGITNQQWNQSGNRVARSRRRQSEDIPALTRFVLKERYWYKSVPLRQHGIETVVFDSADFSDDEVRRLIRQEDISFGELESAHKSQPWYKNVVACGDAAVTFEPFALSRMDILYTQTQTLLKLLPVKTRCVENAQEYNRSAAATFTQLRDYHWCHFHLGRFGRTFSRQNFEKQEESIPAALMHRIDLFKQAGKLAFIDNEIVPPALWISLFMGLGLLPQRYDPRIDLIDEVEIKERLGRMQALIAQTALTMPRLTEYMQRYLGK